MNILLDASAFMAVLINEPEKGQIIHLTKNCTLLAPSMLPYEIGNALTRLKKRKILNSQEVITVFNDFRLIPLRLLDIELENALQIACRYDLYAYDAFYLEIASRLNLQLLTLDNLMKKVAIDLKVKLLEE